MMIRSAIILIIMITIIITNPMATNTITMAGGRRTRTHQA